MNACMNIFPQAYSCEVDVYEKWDVDAKNDDRAVEATLREVSFGLPTKECVVHLVFRPGRRLADKVFDE
jgi:hypothetical protein